MPKEMKKGRTNMRIVKSLAAVFCTLMIVAAFATATPAKAQQEPHYLQSLSELRSARDYIQYDKGAPYGKERHAAVDEINKAIDEIKHAAWDDGKNTQFAPPTHGVNQGWAPIHEATKWLIAARTHVLMGVDTPENAGLRDRIVLHVNEAIRLMNGLQQAGLQ
jgi:hypothetical protein